MQEQRDYGTLQLMFEAALEFFEQHPDKFTTGTFARTNGQKYAKSQAPNDPRARKWSLPGYLIRINPDFNYCYDDAIDYLAGELKEIYGIQTLTQLETVFWFNDEGGIEAVKTLLKRILNGNSSNSD